MPSRSESHYLCNRSACGLIWDSLDQLKSRLNFSVPPAPVSSLSIAMNADESLMSSSNEFPFELPFELTTAVIAHLNPSDIFNASIVCSTWSEACKESSVWRSLYSTAYGALTPQAAIIVESCLSDISFLTLFRGRMRFDIEEVRLSPVGYFAEAVKFRTTEVSQIEQKLLTRRMSKQKLRALGSPQRMVEYSVYIVHIAEQLGIHVVGKKLKSRDGNANHERHSAILLFLTDFLSRVVTELHKAKCYDWARVINDADFALSAIGMPLNDTSFMNNHAASWIQKAQVAMNSENEQERKDIAVMFKHAEEILLAMPEWDLLKYYNLACCYSLQSDFDRAHFCLKLGFCHASEDEWKEMREICRPYQERLNPDGLPDPRHIFPPVFASSHINDLKRHAQGDPDLQILTQFDWYRDLTRVEGGPNNNDAAGDDGEHGGEEGQGGEHADGNDSDSSEYDLESFITDDEEEDDEQEPAADDNNADEPAAVQQVEQDPNEDADEVVDDGEDINEGQQQQ